MAGKSSVDVLKKLEIHTIGDLAKTDPAILELHLKSHGRMLWEFANGMDDSSVQSEELAAKGIGNSTTLPKDVVTREEAQKVLYELSKSVGRRLKKAGQKAGMVSIEIKYATFQRVSHQRQLPRPADEDKVLYEEALQLFDELWSGEPIRLLGVRTSKLSDAGQPQQISLFDEDFIKEQEKRVILAEKHKKVNQAVESICKRYGKDAVLKASDLTENKAK